MIQKSDHSELDALIEKMHRLSREGDDPITIDDAQEFLRLVNEEEPEACARVLKRQQLRKLVASSIKPLADAEIDGIAARMPGGMDGFLKGWGWRQFAREVEEAHGISSF